MDTKEKKSGFQDSKRNRDSLPQTSLQYILQWEAGNSGTTSKPAVGVSVKGRD
jgi:hypothetical protein